MPQHLPDIQPQVFLKANLLRQGHGPFQVLQGQLTDPFGNELADLAHSAFLASAFHIPLAEVESEGAGSKPLKLADNTLRSLTVEIRPDPIANPETSECFGLTIEGTCERKLSCVRCLTEFHQTLAICEHIFAAPSLRPHEHLSAQINPDLSQKGMRKNEIQLHSDDLDVYTMSQKGLAIEEVLLDLIEGATPDYPLCRDTCPGLCHVCGAVLSEGHCGATREDCPIRHGGGIQ